MSLFSTMTIAAGGTFGMMAAPMALQIQTTPREPIEADLEQRYVAGFQPGAGLAPFAPNSIPKFDQYYAAYGDGLIDWMLMDPTIGSAFNTIKEGVLSDGIHLRPAIDPDDYDEGEEDPRPAKDKPTADETAEADLAEEINDFCCRLVERLTATKPLEATVWQLMDCMAYGAEAAEPVFTICRDGPDEGKTILECLDIKPRWSWAFEMDLFGRQIGWRVWNPVEGKSVLLPMNKLVVMTWLPTKGDPRGNTLCRPAFNGYNIKLQTWPEWFQFGQKQAAPSAYGTTAPDAQPRQAVDANGVPIAGKTVSPQKQMSDQLDAFYRNVSYLVGPHGSDLKLLEAKGDGSAFDRLIRACNNETVTAILQATRVTMEAEHGSKADSQTAQDVMGLLVKTVKIFVAAVVRGLLRTAVAANWGDEIAARLTPRVLLGDTDHQDFAAYANAIAAMAQSGLIDVSQVPEIMTWLGVPANRRRGRHRPVVSGAAAAQGSTLAPKEPAKAPEPAPKAA